MRISQIISYFLIYFTLAIPLRGKSLKNGVDIAMHNLIFSLNTYTESHGNPPLNLALVADDEKLESIFESIKNANSDGRNIYYIFDHELTVNVGGKSTTIAAIANDPTKDDLESSNMRITVVIFNNESIKFSKLNLPLSILKKSIPNGDIKKYLQNIDVTNKIELKKIEHNASNNILRTNEPVLGPKSMEEKNHPSNFGMDVKLLNDANHSQFMLLFLIIAIFITVGFWWYKKYIVK